MICKRCGSEMPDTQKFCSECGALLDGSDLTTDAFDTPEPQTPPVQQTPPPVQGAQKAPSKAPKIVAIVLLSVFVIIAIIIAIFALLVRSYAKKYDSYVNEMDMDFEYDDPRDDLDLDKLNEQIEAMKDLELNTDIDVDFKTPEVPETPDVNLNDDETEEEPEGNLTKYSYADVIRNGNKLRITPNGGMSSSTQLFSGKDLDGFLDYVDDKVLEPGRTINRDFFYAMLGCMLVDKDLNSDEENIKVNMAMSLAMANNFHNLDVSINSCDMDGSNPSEYRYNVTEYDKDDIWIVNYRDRTVFFNNGKTEYHSDMFKDEYLAVWLVAIDEYYGL